MKLVFVDDMPKHKVEEAIEYLKNTKLDFEYDIFTSSNPARAYILKNKDKIDLLVVDLGLPLFDDGSDYDKYGGMMIVGEVLERWKKIPIIINSETKLEFNGCKDEEEYFSMYEGSVVKHVKSLTGEFLQEFIFTYLKDKARYTS